jgi:HEAT repeat protein
VIRSPWLAVGAFVVLPLVAGCTSYGPSAGEKWRQFLRGDDPALAARGLLSPSASERRWNIIALARHGDPNATEAFIALLDKSNEPLPLVRATACVGIRALGDKRAVPALLAACRDPAPIVRADAARTVGDLGGPDEIEPLSRLLRQDGDSAVRLEAAYAVRRIGGEKSFPVLVASLSDPDESVAFAAHSALLSLTGQNLSPDPKQWQTWLKQNGKQSGD